VVVKESNNYHITTQRLTWHRLQVPTYSRNQILIMANHCVNIDRYYLCRPEYHILTGALDSNEIIQYMEINILISLW